MIEYRKAKLTEVDILTKMRLSFLCSGKDIGKDKELLLFNNIRHFFYDGMVDESFISLVALHDNRIIATGGLSAYLIPPNLICPSGKTGYISNIYTLPEYRGLGIATKIFSLIVEEAKKLGCERILLNTTDMGRSIYEKYGFEDPKTSMVFYPYEEKNNKGDIFSTEYNIEGVSNL